MIRSSLLKFNYICTMKNTKEKIVDTALNLFNTKGLSQVTLRTIAKEMGISQGNLNYHFKKRADIIEAIYFNLVKAMDGSMAKVEQSEIGLQLLYDISASVMNNSYTYRFFLLDFAQIMRENATIQTHYSNLVNLRKSQTMGLFAMMVEREIMRKEQLPNEYMHLYKRVQIFSDFWMTSAEVEKTQLDEKLVTEYLEIIVQSIYPYLTAKGIEQYNALSL